MVLSNETKASCIPQATCARCGSCTVVCPVYKVTGREALAARGKMHLLTTDLADNPSPVYQDIFAQCLLCGACENICPRQLPLTQILSKIRESFPALYGKNAFRKYLTRKTLSSPSLLDTLVSGGVTLRRLQLLPPDSGLRLKLGIFEDIPNPADSLGGGKLPCSQLCSVDKSPREQSGKITYFTGCLSRHLQPSILKATRELVIKVTNVDPVVPPTQRCCGLAAFSSGDFKAARKLAKVNIEAFEDHPGLILTSCGSCYSHLRSYPQLLTDEREWQNRARRFAERVEEVTSFLVKNQAGESAVSKEELRVFYHDPCHLRFKHKLISPPRKVLDRITGITRLELDDGPQCCGQGGLFHLGYPQQAEDIFSDLYEKVAIQKPGIVVTTCSGCLMQWQQEVARRQNPLLVMHLSTFLSKYIRNASF